MENAKPKRKSPLLFIVGAVILVAAFFGIRALLHHLKYETTDNAQVESRSVPGFQGGRINKNLMLASKTMELNELSKSTLMATLQKDLESTQSDLKAYDEQIRNSEGQIDLSRETLKLTQVRYREGVVTYLDLINASTNLQRANLNKLQYEYQQTLSQVELCRLLGVKFWQE